MHLFWHSRTERSGQSGTSYFNESLRCFPSGDRRKIQAITASTYGEEASGRAESIPRHLRFQKAWFRDIKRSRTHPRAYSRSKNNAYPETIYSKRRRKLSIALCLSPGRTGEGTVRGGRVLLRITSRTRQSRQPGPQC